MKKYMPILFILAIACALSISAVVASDFENQDFDGKFTMDVYKGCDFDRSSSDGIVTFMDIDEGMYVIYSENEVFTPSISDSDLQAFEDASGFEDDGSVGDVRVYKKGDSYGAMVIDDGIIVVVGAQDRDDAINMAKSIEFTD